jgi:hypothetical protein
VLILVLPLSARHHANLWSQVPISYAFYYGSLQSIAITIHYNHQWQRQGTAYQESSG